MPNLFEVTDPQGRTIVCTLETWNGHILENHPDMKGYENEVGRAIEAPSLGIYRDSVFENRHIYYNRFKRKPRYIKVVVEFGEEVGKVITAFFTDATKSGEKMIWPISSG
jgi:hypothetical protein